jgi:uncharacterized membrane protein
MLWFHLTIASAFSLATADALTKRVSGRTGSVIAAWLRSVIALPFLLMTLFFVEIPEIGPDFWWVIAVSLPFEVAATLLYVRAIHVSPLSLTLPFLAFTPIYLLFTSYVTLGEVPSRAGVAGVLLIAAGAYTLNLGSIRRGGILAPFRAILRERGSMMMMGVAVIYAVTSDLGKMAINNSSATFFGPVYWAAFCVVLTPVAYFMKRKEFRAGVATRNAAAFIPAGFAHAVMVALHMVAISLTQVSYMIAVKRTSLLFGAVFGYFMFAEKNIGERAFGAALMFAGLVVMVMAGG